jgi:hypothetical protein
MKKGTKSSYKRWSFKRDKISATIIAHSMEEACTYFLRQTDHEWKLYQEDNIWKLTIFINGGEFGTSYSATFDIEEEV